MSRADVVVVGGGLAGMAAAVKLADSGAQVTLLEARPHLGGATWSFPRSGLVLDNGHHLFLRCCVAYRSFLARIGTERSTVLQSRLDLPVLRRRPGGRAPAVSRLRADPLPAPAHLLRSLASYRHLRIPDRVRIVLGAEALRRANPDDPRLDELDLLTFLRRAHQSQAAIDALWGLICRPTLNLAPEHTSAAQAAMVLRTALLGDPGAADLGWSTVPLSTLHGDAVERVLAERGATVRRRAFVRSVETSSAGVSVELEGGQRLCAEAAVVAVPWHVVGSLLDDSVLGPSRANLDELGASPIVNAYVVLDRPILDEPVAACLSTPIEWLFDVTEKVGLEGGQCLNVTLSAADSWQALRTTEIAAGVRAALLELFPRARSSRILDIHVTREPRATFRAAPGQARLRPGPRTRHRQVALAGAWTATGWPATMEGAVRSGWEAAATLSAAEPGEAGLEGKSFEEVIA
jgi:squalene-associated FAD-dependent desaturase